MEYAPIESAVDATAMPDGVEETRTNVRQRRIVDAGIAMQGSMNTMSAVEYLRRRDIGAAVIQRVLLEPHRRRTRS